MGDEHCRRALPTLATDAFDAMERAAGRTAERARRRALRSFAAVRGLGQVHHWTMLPQQDVLAPICDSDSNEVVPECAPEPSQDVHTNSPENSVIMIGQKPD